MFYYNNIKTRQGERMNSIRIFKKWFLYTGLHEFECSVDKIPYTIRLPFKLLLVNWGNIHSEKKEEK